MKILPHNHQMTTHNGKLKIPIYLLLDPNEDSITPNDNSKWKIENSLTQMKIQSPI